MRERFGAEVAFVETDLFRLVGGQRSAALDALMRGDDLPFVIINDEVVSAGALDPDVIAQGIERHLGAE